MKIYLLEDKDSYRLKMEIALTATFPESVDIFCSGNDVDFPRQIISDWKKGVLSEDCIVILDIELPSISYFGHWCKKNDSVEVVQKSEFGRVKFENAIVHGWNIYYLIRALSRKIRIVVVSSHPLNEMKKHIDGNQLPEVNSEYFLYIYRDMSSKEIIKVIVDHFK